MLDKIDFKLVFRRQQYFVLNLVIAMITLVSVFEGCPSCILFIQKNA